MSKFKPGVRVVVIDNDTHEIRKGVIDNIYDVIEVAIIKFDDGNVEKVSFEYLGIEPKTEVQEKPTEPVEKSEITITQDEFTQIASKVIAKSVEKLPGHGGMLGLAFTLFVTMLHKELFSGAVDNG